VHELYLPLSVGARVIIASRETILDGDALRASIEKTGATMMQATPSLWRVLLAADWRPSQAFKGLCGGEALPRDLARELNSRRVEVWNMYGPTETTVWSTCARIGSEDRITLGRTNQLCRQCSLPINSHSDYCGQCLRHPPAFALSVIPFGYQYPLDGLIHQFKYRGKLTQGRLLAQALANFVDYYYQELGLPLPDLLLPTPMHWTRLLVRGFNQTAFLAQELATRLQIPLAESLCRRRKRTPTQQGLSRSRRQKNLRGAFYISPRAQIALRDKRIALLDDVVTTGSTARELSRVLMEAGAAEVHLWALARTPEHPSEA
jgi:ComF family protein